VHTPLASFGTMGTTWSLAVALVIGMAFGWALERAGLGSARKLIGQFLLTDFTVFKVMFSAIVTAMLGVFWLGRAGVLDVSRIYVPETFLVPQLIGGVVFGAGFVIAALCPGTSCVAAATGRGDGLAVVVGMLTGVLGAGLTIRWWESFYDSTPRGSYTLPAALHASYGLTVAVIVGAALLAFLILERFEGRRRPRASPAPTWLTWTAMAGGALAPLAGNPYVTRQASIDVTSLASDVASERDHVGAVDVAEWIKDRKPDLHIIDVRSAAEFDEYHLPTAENVPIENLPSATLPRADTLVLYSEGGAHAAQAWVFLRALGYSHVFFLRGGVEEWEDDVMHPVADGSPASARAAPLSRYFGGGPRPPGTPIPTRRHGC
jgi:rhodanese-related sulfurtransferase/uncharacterized membrane protein YedE/YeeE